MLNITDKQEKELDIQSLFSEIQEITDKTLLNIKNLFRKFIHKFGIGCLYVLMKKMSDLRADMADACNEYSKGLADKVFIYAANEGLILAQHFFV